MYPIEYTCTKEEIINTGISIDTVKESKLNPHDTLKDSESIHLNKWIDTGILFKPTSKKASIANVVVVITQQHVINCAPLTPSFRPNKPDEIEPNKGKINKAKYIT
jgi:hypothetical protein